MESVVTMEVYRGLCGQRRGFGREPGGGVNTQKAFPHPAVYSASIQPLSLHPTNNRHSTNVVLISGCRLRRQPDIKTTLDRAAVRPCCGVNHTKSLLSARNEHALKTLLMDKCWANVKHAARHWKHISESVRRKLFLLLWKFRKIKN